MTTFEDLIEPVTANEARAMLRELVITSPAQISAEVLDTPTTPEAAIIYALGEAEGNRSPERAFFARSAARSTATDPYLRVISNEQFSLPARGKTFATTTIELSNASNSYYGPYLIGQFVARNRISKKLYSNTSPIGTITSGTVGLLVDVIALEAGEASSALPDEITELETALTGVTITNPAAALARDEETKESLNGRIDAKIGSLGTPGARGWNTGATSTAFEAVAKNGPEDLGGCPREDGSFIEVTRTQVVRDDEAGTITLYLADDDGPLLTSDVDIIRPVVQLYTEWLGLDVSVENSTLVTVTYNGTLTISAKGVAASDVSIQAAAQASLTTAGRILEIGEGPTLDYGRDAILDVGNASNATAFRLKTLVLSTPSIDTVLADGEVASLVLGTLTILRT